jgi:hypothetical protein
LLFSPYYPTHCFITTFGLICSRYPPPPPSFTAPSLAAVSSTAHFFFFGNGL